MNWMPAEWEPHSATWLAWPHNPDTWPGRLKFIPSVWTLMIKALHVHETVNLLINNEETEKEVRLRLQRADIDSQKVRLHKIPTNDCWMRDIGPTFVKSCQTRPTGQTGLTAVSWLFNSWGEKWPPWDLDAQVSSKIAEATKIPPLRPKIVMEGGSLETNGEVLLTTQSCLLSKKRNPSLKQGDIELVLKEFLGVKRVVWLPGGDLPGDDTDGHIDNIARFVNKSTIVSPRTSDRGHPCYTVFEENYRLLQEMKEFRLIPLPVPSPLEHQGVPLPCSYANFYIANGVVLIPTFGVPEDDEAVRILRKLFPARRVVPIDARELVIGLGACHCVTQQQPG